MKKNKNIFKTNIAHRGLWGESNGVVIPENSLAAFEAAAAKGFGIELDVTVTADGVPVVFHDTTLDRMTGESGRVDECSYHKIKDLNLRLGSTWIPDQAQDDIQGTDQHIPTLKEALALVNGRVPIFVEVKGKTFFYKSKVRAVLQDIESYDGAYVVGSFDPRIVRFFGNHLGSGKVSLIFRDIHKCAWRWSLFAYKCLAGGVTYLSVPWRVVREDFVQSEREQKWILTWTSKEDSHQRYVTGYADSMIFEEGE